MAQETAMNNQEETKPIVREIAQRFVADLPPSTDCAFNVAKKGTHRFCSRMGRKEVGGYYFCQRHADVVAAAILESL
jgi:hypothetical protein